MKKVYYDWNDVEQQTQDIIRQIHLSDWKPDYIVGLTRGGLTPANLISQYLEVSMHTLKVSLRDDADCETNCWMAEDAYDGKNILIVDDINDSGATLNWIRQDWQGSNLPNDSHWAQVWGENVRVAVLVDNQSSDCEVPVSYSAVEVNKLEDPQWIVFPWEDWWQR